MTRTTPPFAILAFCFLALSSLILPCVPAHAVSVAARQWEMSADKLTRYENPPRIVAEGNVLLEKKEPAADRPTTPPAQWSDLLGVDPPQKNAPQPGEPEGGTKTVTTVQADWVAYDINRGVMEAKGHLLIEIDTDRLSADSGTIDLGKATGVFENATVIRKQKDIHFEGKVIEKTGALTYHIEDGWVVTCKLAPGEVPPWSFAAADAEITDGGYAYLKHATFRIKDVPVLYSPVMLLPAKRKRQTGLLFPSFAMSDRDGFNLEIPLFVNLSPSADLTLYPRYYANRGVMTGAELRYALAEDSKGMLMGNYLDDALSDPSEVDYYEEGQFTHTNADRYWIRGKADQTIGSWTVRLDLDVASDLDYLREFNTGSTGFSASQDRFAETFGRGFIDKTNRYRENTLATLRSWNYGASLLGEFQAVNDITEQIYTADNPSQAWKLPSLAYSGLVPVGTTGGPDFSWDANYVNFWRDKGVGAQRIDLLPKLTTGIPLTPYLETVVSGGVRETAYLVRDNGAAEWEDTDSKDRFLTTFDGEIGTTLLRDFAFEFGEAALLSHTLRPFVAYSYTAIPEQKILPEFDAIDELEEENTLYYGVSNFFTAFGQRNGREFEREFGFLKVKQGIDLREDVSEEPLTPVIIETGAYPLEHLRVKYTTYVDVYGDGAFRHSIDSDYASSSGDTFSLDYRYNELTDVNSVRGSAWYLLPYNFAAGYSLERAIEQSETIEEIARLRYIQPCWSVELSSHATPGDQTFMVTFRLANIGNSLDFNVPGL